MQNLSLLQKFDPSWTVDDLAITINGNLLDIRQLLTYEVFWYGSTVQGVISFSDYKDFSRICSLDAGGFLEVSFTSQENSRILDPAPFKKTFSITKTVNGENNPLPLIEIYFQDTNTQKLKSSYISNTYKDSKPADSFSKYFEDLGLEEVTVAGNPAETETDIHTPAHKNAYEYFAKESAYRGYEFIQDRNTNYIVHDSHRTNEKAVSTGEVFEYKPSSVSTRGQIIEYNTEGFDIKALEKSMPTSATSINNENTNKSEMSTKVTKITGSGGSVGGDSKASDLYVSNGTKQTGGIYSTADADTLTKELKNLQSMSIWVPGWNGNRLGMKIKVELPRPVQVGQSTSDEVYSGDWIVNKCRDKIINSYFIQELFISRAGEIT